MSYGTMAAFRIILPEEAATPDLVLQRYLDAAKAMVDTELGFQFDGPEVTVRLSGWDEYELLLPAPGARSITDIYERDVLVPGTEYELEPMDGRYLYRLTPEGLSIPWAAGERTFRVRYVPAACPADLVQAELTEATRLWRGKVGGYSDVIGVEGVNDLVYSKAMAASSRQTIDAIKRKHRRMPGMGGA